MGWRWVRAAISALSICQGARCGSDRISQATVTCSSTLRSASKLPVEWWNSTFWALALRRSLVEGLAEITTTGLRSTYAPAMAFTALKVPTPYCSDTAPRPCTRA